MVRGKLHVIHFGATVHQIGSFDLCVRKRKHTFLHTDSYFLLNIVMEYREKATGLERGVAKKEVWLSTYVGTYIYSPSDLEFLATTLSADPLHMGHMGCHVTCM